MIQVARPEIPRQAIAAAKSVSALVLGLAIGHGLMWGAGFLGYFLGEGMRSQELADRQFLGGLLLGVALVGLALAAAGIGGRRVPGWLSAFLLGAAASPSLSLFGFLIFIPCWGCD